MRYCVIDLETNILNDLYGNMKAAWFYPSNGIVLGWGRLVNWPSVTENYVFRSYDATDTDIETIAYLLENSDFLVGHNIKFDLLYLRKFYNELYQKFIKRGGYVWDTQVVEYLLSGQSKTYPSLDYCSEKYGGTLKDDKIKEYWNNGIDTSDIPLTELQSYLIGDIDNTQKVFEEQMAIVDELGMLPLVNVQMEALLALVEIEWNGMHFNKEESYKEEIVLAKEVDLRENWLQSSMSAVIPNYVDGMPTITPNSPKQLSLFLFGGEVAIKTYVNMLDDDGNPVLYKSGPNKGKQRTKVSKEKLLITSPWNSSCLAHTTKTKNGYYSTDDEVLKKLHASSTWPVVVEFCERLLKYRSMKKDLSTYYQALRGLCVDNTIYPNYNQCATATGRLSSSSPNAQNLTKKGE